MQARSPSGFHVDHEFELGRLLDRQVSCSLTFEDAVNVHRRLTECLGRVDPVGDKSAGCCHVPPRVNDGHAMTVCKGHDEILVHAWKGIRHHHDGAGLGGRDAAYETSYLFSAVHRTRNQLYTEGVHGGRHGRHVESMAGAVRGLNIKLMRATCGAHSLRSSIHLPPSDPSASTNPVMLPPGRDRLETKPLPIGSETFTNTIGISRVSRCSTAATQVVAATITSSCSPTSSLANACTLSRSPAPQRCSIWMVRPDIHPRLRSASVNAVTFRSVRGSPPPAHIAPIRRTRSGCCAGAERDHVASRIPKVRRSPAGSFGPFQTRATPQRVRPSRVPIAAVEDKPSITGRNVLDLSALSVQPSDCARMNFRRFISTTTRRHPYNVALLKRQFVAAPHGEPAAQDALGHEHACGVSRRHGSSSPNSGKWRNDLAAVPNEPLPMLGSPEPANGPSRYQGAVPNRLMFNKYHPAEKSLRDQWSAFGQETLAEDVDDNARSITPGRVGRQPFRVSF